MSTQPGTSRVISWNRLVQIHDPNYRLDEPVVYEFGFRRFRERRGRPYGMRQHDTSVVEPKSQGRSPEPR